ncbi:(2Fe-2S)-binding protein [Paenibacillus ihumii]|uniref:(2Fe-2S)-binding protein n=1 Tax=Paenibacillus ihumii TaxID=687436 RepID=UPI0006D7DD71|nr:(2Fe-2S)-binding protein [Paenibacillus ihumii]
MDRLAIDYSLLEQQCYVVREPRDQAIYTIEGKAFLDRNRTERFLTMYQSEIKGLDIQVAATYFAASWRVLCAAVQYMVSLTSPRLNLHLENLTLQVVRVNEFPMIFFVLGEDSEIAWPGGKAGEWQEQQLGSFYKETLRPVMESAAEVSKLPVTQLWGQLPLGIAYYIKQMANKLDSAEHRAKLQADHESVKEMSAEWFGIKRNPFAIKQVLVDHPYSPGEKMPLKPTCCLAYRTSTGLGYCYSCPKLTKQQREEKRMELLHRQAQSSKT